ncbi:hypothetical protein ACROYT_G020447, partial [Oculina patagonica]
IVVIMDLQKALCKKVLFCPVASVYSLSTSAADDEDSKILAGCFKFSNEVGPGWIGYRPNKITVITSNDMFTPTRKNYDIVHAKKQMIRVKKHEDISTLEALLEKPVLMCVTRRQYCGTPVNVSPTDTENLCKQTVSGFDIDFAVIFPPALLKAVLKDTLELIRLYLTKKQKFCLMIDLKQVLKEFIPQELQDADSLEYVSWHNTAFWITNHCKPHRHSLMYINSVLFWTALFPVAFFAALPYRAGRRLLCKDGRLALRNPMKFKVTGADDKVVVCVWSSDPPPPGEYKKYINRYAMNTARLNWLAPFLRSSDMIKFDFGEENEEEY